jgi:hypothetical protein
MTRYIWASAAILVPLVSGCGPAAEVCKQDFITTHPDVDGDGYGDSSSPENTCGVPKGRVENSGDCNDNEPLSHIDAEEICDNQDNDCNGQVDEGLPFEIWYIDEDGDGFGSGNGGQETCLQPANSVADNTDCDDLNEAIHPAASEVCDEVDNDCDELIDDLDDDTDPNSMTVYYRDQDGDGFGDFLSTLSACIVPVSGADNGDDCNDNVFAVNPDAAEICNGEDDNCDTLVDEDDPGIDPALLTQFFTDSDGDGFGDILAPVDACEAGPGLVDNADDCDDTNLLLGLPSDWFFDGDLDGFGFGAPIEYQVCIPTDPALVPDGQGLDCDDGDANINPLAFEICGDGVDSNCDRYDCDIFVEDFESGVLEAYWSLAGNANWLMLGANPYEGAFGAKSGNIGNNELSRMSMELDMTDAGTVSFWHSGDTEANFDFLYVYVDGAQRFSKAGSWSWTETVFNLNAGLHTIEWRYEKDVSVSVGADTVYLDYITVIGGAPL